MPLASPSRYLLKSYMMESPAVEEMAAHMVVPGKRFSSPIIVGWLVTTKCQLKCRHCWVDREQPEASPSDRKIIAGKLAKENLCRVCLSGGEVTLIPELGEYVRILKETGTPLSIYTNAIDPIGYGRGNVWLDHWDFEIDYAQVSLDGGTQKDFEAQRGKGTFKPFLKGVDLLHRNGARTLARYIATPFNRADVYSAARLAMDLGFEGFAAEIYYPRGRATSIGMEDAIRTANQFNASVRKMVCDTELMESSLRLGIAFPTLVPFPDYVRSTLPKGKVSLRKPIQNGTVHCFVTPTGEVVPASHLGSDRSFWCGSLLQKSLGEIWKNGSVFERIPKERNLSGTRCSTCPDLEFCQGGHEQRALSHFGTYNAPDPYCYFSRQEAPSG